MKNSIRFLASAVAAVALFVSTNTSAQTKELPGDSHALRLGIGLDLGLATKDPYGFVPGGDLRLQKDFSSNVSGILSAGYTSFTVKSKYKDIFDNYSLIPVKAGLKVFPMERVYISGEVGAGFGTKSGSKTGFIYAPGVGLGLNNGLDLSLRYEGMSVSGTNLDQVALRIAYGFKL